MSLRDPLESNPDTANARRLGSTIGSYRLLSILGSGGMGTVYLAEHLRTGRQVAVKLLRPEMQDRAEVGKRFLAEARAMGRMSHRGVVSIIDSDSLPDGTAYLVMEYLPGVSLRTELREANAPLSLAASLQILHQAALAMAAAHAAGVIHRDLSPANIMVSPRDSEGWPQIKILDFGLARVFSVDGGSDPSLSTTRDGAVLGTLKYMAPEQCLDPHAVDEQADVYALGVIGYELLAGRPPFSAAASFELIGHHLRDPPPPLPPVAAGDGAAIPPELAALILQMLQKSPLKRPDMAEVARQLQPLLFERALRPIAGGQKSTVRWRRLRFVGLCGAFGALACGLVGVGIDARKERRLAELRRAGSLTVASEMLGVINRQLRSIPSASSASLELLDTTARLLDGLNSQSPTDLEARESLARLHTLRGELFRNHGGLGDARREFEHAIEDGAALVTARPDNIVYRARLASAHDGLADVLEQLTELPAARRHYEQALTIRLELLKKSPDDPARVQDAVASYLLRGDLLKTQGLQQLAAADYQLARTLLEPIWKREPDKKNYRWQMCGVLYRLAQTLLVIGKSADSLQYAERSIELLSRIAPTDQQGASYHLLLSRLLQTRGDVRDRLGRTSDAEHDFAQAFEEVRGLLKASPSDVQVRRALIDSGYRAIDQWLRVGKIDIAETFASQLESAAESLLKADASHQGHKWRLAGSLQRIGDVQMQRGRADEARRTYQRALEIQEALRAQSPDYSRNRDRTVWLWERQGDAAARGAFAEQALHPWAQALALLDELQRADPATTEVRLGMARILRKRAALRDKLKQREGALADWQQALQITEALCQSDPADAAAQRELILSEFSRTIALGSAIDAQPQFTAARDRLAKLRAQGLLLGDVELDGAEQLALSTTRARPLQ